MKIYELQCRLEQYLAMRHALGFVSKPTERLLHDFVKWLESQNFTGTITAQHAIDWASQAPHSDQVGRSARRLSMIRGFLTYIRALEPETEIPEHGVFSAPIRPQPHIYSKVEIQNLLEEAQKLRPQNALRPYTYYTLIGLLASCGLRISEALNLGLTDVELNAEPARLIIRKTKFGKSRIVPLHTTTTKAMIIYTEKRLRLGYDGFCDSFFVSEKLASLNLTTVERTFLILARRIGLRGPVGEPGPRLGDLRHTFVVERLRLWYQEGCDVRRRLPELSVFVGHSRLEHTYWYLTSTPELLGTAAKRFESYSPTGGVQ